MLKNKFKILLSIFLIVLLASSLCFATDDIDATAGDSVEEEVTSDSENLDPAYSELVSDDLYLSGDTIEVTGIIDGNAFIIGKDVTISAQIGGDVFIIAENLTVTNMSYIYSSIFGVVSNMNVNGIVYDIYAVCNNFTLESNGYVYRDLRVFGDTVNINGIVRRNAYLNSDNIVFSELTDTYIQGNLTYSAANEVTIPESAVSGEVTFNEALSTDVSVGSKILSTVLEIIGTLIFTLILTFLSMLVAPNFLKKTANMKVSTFFINLGVGLGTLILVPVVFVLLLCTVVGVPTSLSLIILYILLLAAYVPITSIAIASFVNKKLKLSKKLHFVLITLAIALIISILALIPFVKVLVTFVAMCFALGVVIYNLFTKVPVEE